MLAGSQADSKHVPIQSKKDIKAREEQKVGGCGGSRAVVALEGS